MAEKRIVCFEVSGECRYFRDLKEQFFDVPPGTYCAACLHSGWESIDPSACKTCKRDKSFEGRSRQEVLKQIEKHLLASTIKFNTTADVVAEIALNALLERN